jgi:hypothetical protein
MTIEDIVLLVDNSKNYIEKIKEMDLSIKDSELLINVFEYLQEGNNKAAIRLLEWIGDTYIREKFADLVLKLQ